MNTAHRLLRLTAQLHDLPGLTVEDLDDLQLLATCGLPLQARLGRYRLAPLQVEGQALDLEETLGAALALMLTTGPALTPQAPVRAERSSTRKRRLKAFCDRVAATRRNTGTGPS